MNTQFFDSRVRHARDGVFIEMERQFYCSLINRRREYITWNPTKPITGLDL
jgi:hypothetical protein